MENQSMRILRLSSTQKLLSRECGASGKEPICQYRRHKACEFQSLGGEDLLEEVMATHSRILDFRIPWTEETGGLQSIRAQRVRHD